MDAKGNGYGNFDIMNSKLLMTVDGCGKAAEALAASEVPVGCVFVRDGRVIAQARNRTNELRNVCRHSHTLSIPKFTEL